MTRPFHHLPPRDVAFALFYSPGVVHKLTLPGAKLYRSFHKVIPSGQSFSLPLTPLKNIEDSALFNRDPLEMTGAVYMTPIDSSPMLRTPFPIMPVLVFVACAT